MSKGKKVILVVVAVFIATVILFFLEKNRVNTDSADNPAVKIQKKQKVKEKIVSNLNTALRKSLKQVNPEEMEKVFNEKTELSPLPFDEVEKLEGENLQKRVSELDAKLDHAIQKYPDLPPPPEWYLREKEHLENKFFATVGKSRYETELTEEQKERQQRYLSYLDKIKKSGEIVSDEELTKTKEQILGE